MRKTPGPADCPEVVKNNYIIFCGERSWPKMRMWDRSRAHQIYVIPGSGISEKTP